MLFFHESIGPHGGHQVLTSHQFPPPLDQDQKNLTHSLRFQGNDLVATEKKMSLPVQPELTEFVNDPRLVRGLSRRASPILPQSSGPNGSLRFFLFIGLRTLQFPRKNPGFSPGLDKPPRIIFAMPHQNSHLRQGANHNDENRPDSSRATSCRT